jgi:hypothetical protein
VKSALEAGLKVVDLLSFGLGIEGDLGVVLQGKLFGAEELGLGSTVWDVNPILSEASFEDSWASWCLSFRNLNFLPLIGLAVLSFCDSTSLTPTEPPLILLLRDMSVVVGLC